MMKSLDEDQWTAVVLANIYPLSLSFDRVLTGVPFMRVVSVEEAVTMIPDGASIMVGGFMGVGTPERLLDELVRQKKSGLSLISNDAAIPGRGIGKLFDASLVASLT